MDKALKLEILELMIKARCLEERMVKMSKSSDGFFWLGGVGEEAFNIPLGMLAKCRSHAEDPDHNPLDYDFFHFHYRNAGTMLAFGMEPVEEIRQMHNRASDPFSGGRNFCNHFSRKKWNVVPVTSTIQTQCVTAPGTALAQKLHGGDGLTVVTFGDAGTAEGDFHVGLNWATQPVKNRQTGEDLGVGTPLLFICTNNQYGISTDYSDVHGQDQIVNIAAGYGMPTKVINGNDVEESWNALKEAMDYVRKERKPYFLEAMVSRLNGHSSSSGANRVKAVASEKEHVPGENEVDPLLVWVNKLVKSRVIKKDYFSKRYEEETERMKKILAEVKQEAGPEGESIYNHTFMAEIPGREAQQYE